MQRFTRTRKRQLRADRKGFARAPKFGRDVFGAVTRTPPKWPSDRKRVCEVLLRTSLRPPTLTTGTMRVSGVGKFYMPHHQEDTAHFGIEVIMLFISALMITAGSEKGLAHNLLAKNAWGLVPV